MAAVAGVVLAPRVVVRQRQARSGGQRDARSHGHDGGKPYVRSHQLRPLRECGQNLRETLEAAPSGGQEGLSGCSGCRRTGTGHNVSWTFSRRTGTASPEVAACTHRTVLADPAANAQSVLRIARSCHDEGVAVAVFPELTLSGYSLGTSLLGTACSTPSRPHWPTSSTGSADLLPVLVVGAPLRHLHRLYNAAVVIHRGASSGWWSSPTCRPTASSTSAARWRPATTCAAPSGCSAPTCRSGPICSSTPTTFPAWCCTSGDLRGHVRSDPAERAGGIGRCDRAGQPVRQPDHHRHVRKHYQRNRFVVAACTCWACVNRKWPARERQISSLFVASSGFAYTARGRKSRTSAPQRCGAGHQRLPRAWDCRMARPG